MTSTENEAAKNALLLDPIPTVQTNQLPSQFLILFTCFSHDSGTARAADVCNKQSGLSIGFGKVAEILSERRSMSKG